MARTIVIGGVSRNVQELRLSAVQNGIDRLSVGFLVPSGEVWPAMDDVITYHEDALLMFGGTVKVPDISAFGEEASEHVASTVSSLDYNELAERRKDVNLTIPAGTLKAGVTLLLPYLDGVSLDAAWTTDGPDVEEFVLEDASTKIGLDEFSTRTGWLYNIGYDKKLLFFDPALAPAAPWDVNDGDGNVIGDVRVSESRLDYINRIVVKFMERARAAYAFLRATANFADAETVTVGSKTYTFQAVLTDVDGNVKIGASAEASLNNLAAAITLGGTAGTDYAASMTLNPQVTAYWQTADMMKAVALTAGASGNGIGCTHVCANADWITEGSIPTIVLTFGADAATTNRTVVDDAVEQALYGIYSDVAEAINVYDETSAQELGSGILDVRKVTEKKITYRTTRGGLFPGMLQTILCAKRALNVSALITEVVTSIRRGYLERAITAIAGTVYKGSKWRDQYKKWSGTVSGSAQTVSWSGGGTGTSMNARVYYLGMSEGKFASPAAATWSAISGLPFAATENFTGRVRAWVRERSAGAEVQIRLAVSDDDITYTNAVGLSSVSSATRVMRMATINLVAGKYYRLEVYTAAADRDIEAMGYVESLG